MSVVDLIPVGIAVGIVIIMQLFSFWLSRVLDRQWLEYVIPLIVMIILVIYVIVK